MTYENSVIEASVKTTNKSTVIVFDYYTEGHLTYLGQFERVIPSGDTVPVDVNDSGALEQYAIKQFPNRQVQ